MMLGGIRNKRQFLAEALDQLGILALLERIIAKRDPGLIVLTYHRIAEPGSDLFYDPVISATPESFRSQVKWLSNHVRVLSLEELVAQIESQSPWREPVTLLTFDDGYRDNLDLAAPILRERGIPATFFLPTDFLDSPQLPWWDFVACAIKQTRVRQLKLDQQSSGGLSVLEIDMQSTPPDVAIMKIINRFLDGTITDGQWFLNQLADRAEVEIDSVGLGRELFMTWNQIRDLAHSGLELTVGSHGQSHRRLAGLDEDTQFYELMNSKQVLEERLGRAIKAFAYPYGWPGTFTDATKVLAAKAGYHLAFSAHVGINRFGKFDQYSIRRLGVGSTDSAVLLRARSALQSIFGKSFL